ncbi:DUF1285 domain-containing protein [Halomonas urumqiensis]|uniref:DUF1285 domain-containing protein n=1 Tax=Halomonas urumqiensis TaxID=1684789 RepID=A0A2N7UGL2_9GAMM|nr:DUF1285 domain-containing protein [Halomonas urumqiensis]PMR79540.1 DUF1285 domain-containing protein [Halomonas urumqiensis]PTB01339.1 DUF1285 domain-containing protein [Halomonas urumqiensis]GHE22586.1 hypothetical protein GCM10017767_31070 [Halomonas urumqiensis]
MNLDPLLAHITPHGEIPPVDRWHPEQRGEMDLVIAADGRWIHEGTAITRPRLVRLLSTILRRESDGDYALVTPVEWQRIRVEDRPFVIIDAEPDDAGCWWLTTNVGDRLALDETRCLSLSETPAGEWIPEVAVRFGLSARLGRNVYYRLVEQAESRPCEEGGQELGFMSAGILQVLGRLDDESPCA